MADKLHSQLGTRALLVLVLSLLVSSCASLPDPESAQTHHSSVIAVLGGEPGQAISIGQVFTPRRSKINSISVWLSQPAGGDRDVGSIFDFQLFAGSDSTGDLRYQATYQLPSANFTGPFRITFPVQADSAERPFYLLLSPIQGSLEVWGRAEEAYPGGQAQVNGEWVDSDLAFSLTYRYGLPAAIEDWRRFSEKFWLFLLSGILIVLPGWLVLGWLGINKHFRFWEQFALSAGLSLALIPIIVLWTRMTGFRWSFLASLIFAGALVLGGILRIYRNKPWKNQLSISLSDAALAMVLVFSLWVRIAMVRDLAGSPWVDSVHHAFITRLIQEQGGIPVGYSPHFLIHPTAYHPGFHTNLALFHWLSQSDIVEAMLVYGQVLNWLAVLASYLFAKSITKNPWVGICSALAAGLLTPLPAYLTSWGRYTHLAGLITLVMLVALSETLFNAQTSSNANERQISGQKLIPWIAACSLGVAGLSLVHYRVIAFLGLWWLATLLSSLPDSKTIIRRLQLLLLITIPAFLIAAPWAISAIFNTFLPYSVNEGSRPAFFSDFDFSLVTAATGLPVLVAAGAGLVLFQFGSRRKSFAISLWIIFMFVLANLGSFGLPGGSLANNISVEITLFLPVSMLAGFTIVWLTGIVSNRLPKSWLKPFRLLLAIALVVLLVVGFNRLVPVLNPSTVLMHQSDIVAIAWIDQTIQDEETFLINPVAWGKKLCVGSDGGYWITPLAGNGTYPPPLLYGYGSRESIAQINEICDQSRKYAGSPGDVHKIMARNGIRYVYLGGKGGVFSASLLSESGFFREIYSQLGVWIFEIAP